MKLFVFACGKGHRRLLEERGEVRCRRCAAGDERLPPDGRERIVDMLTHDRLDQMLESVGHREPDRGPVMVYIGSVERREDETPTQFRQRAVTAEFSTIH